MDVSRNNSTSPGGRIKASTAKWGAACGPCATAKAKCIRTNSSLGSKCDRCERLFKDCSDQVHRPRKKRQVRPSRTAQIEERLNGLVNLLKASGELTHAELATDTTCIPTEVDPAVSDQRTPSESPAGSFQPSFNPWAVPESYNSYAPPTCICRPQGGDAPPPPETDEASLNIFRNQLQRFHPFVVVPAHISAAALKSTRPFLMSAIRMVASFRNLRSMRAQMYHLMKHLSDHMLIRSEKSLDLLLGIIVIAGWYQYHCFMHAQLNNLLSLAVSLVGELGLHRHPAVNERSVRMTVKFTPPAARTNEERRAYLGVWFLTSSISISFSRLESMRYANYLQECLKDLEVAEEYKTDASIAYLVRIQHLTERAHQLNAKDEATEEVAGLPTAPMSAYVSAFQGELDRIKEALPEEIKSDHILMTYFYTATLRLYEPPIIDTKLVSSISSSLTTNSAGAASPLDRIYHSRNALVAWFENWLKVPVSLYYCQTTPLAAQLVYGLTMLGRWARLATPGTLFDCRSPIPIPDNPSTNSSDASTSRNIWAAETTRLVHTETCSFTHHPGISHNATDPKLPGAVALLRAKLKEQPGLLIDVAYFLSTFGTRFEEANAMFRGAFIDSATQDQNIWRMGAIKIRITQAKLERWAEIVARGTEELSLDDPSMEDRVANTRGTAMDDPSDYVSVNMPSDQMDMRSFNGTPWSNDMMQGVDPTGWYDGYLDWSTVIMNSMGTMEHDPDHSV